MLGAARWSLVPALLALSMAWPSAAYAIVPQVHDHGNFFNADTVTKANAILLDIQKKHKKDVVVETFDKIPDEMLKKFPYENTEKGMNSFFDQWAKDIARNGKVDGIVILICKNQKNDNKTRVQEEVGEYTREKMFKESDRVDLHNVFLNEWSKNHNAALLDGLKSIDSRMADHHKTAAKGAAAVAAQPSSGSSSSNTATDHGSNILGWVCIGVCVLIGIWLIFGLIRAFSGGGGGYAGGGGGGYGYGGGGGGGGFMSGLMGGLFGAMAGNWIYNNMFGGHSSHSFGESSAHASGPASAGNDDFGPSDQGGGFSGGGGDVDGGSGGDVDSGDAGGGGGGGGDWGGGGGDWGGGGDAGGGGGDWGGGGGGDFGGGGGGDFGGGGGGDFGGGGGGGDW